MKVLGWITTGVLILAVVVVASSTRPEPMVLATAVPANAPMKLNAAAIRMAWRGCRARECVA